MHSDCLRIKNHKICDEQRAHEQAVLDSKTRRHAKLMRNRDAIREKVARLKRDSRVINAGCDDELIDRCQSKFSELTDCMSEAEIEFCIDDILEDIIDDTSI